MTTYHEGILPIHNSKEVIASYHNDCAIACRFLLQRGSCLSSSQIFFHPLEKSLTSELLQPDWRLTDGHLGWEEAFPFTGRVGKHFRLHLHSLAGRSISLSGLWPSQCPCDLLEPYVRVTSRQRTCIVSHPMSHE